MKTYLTEYLRDGWPWCGDDIKAESWEEAQDVADDRGLGERVVGTLVYSRPLEPPYDLSTKH